MARGHLHWCSRYWIFPDDSLTGGSFSDRSFTVRNYTDRDVSVHLPVDLAHISQGR